MDTWSIAEHHKAVAGLNQAMRQEKSLYHPQVSCRTEPQEKLIIGVEAWQYGVKAMNRLCLTCDGYEPFG